MKTKKEKTEPTSALSKAVNNVKQMIKKKDKDSVKKKVLKTTVQNEKDKKKLKNSVQVDKNKVATGSPKPKKEKKTVKNTVKSKKEKDILNDSVQTKMEKKIEKSTELVEKENNIVVAKKEKKPFTSTRGVMYIGHIPYGFFENEMKEYFEQFGTVTRVRVARSNKTGKSRGYGYIEFEEQDVAKIAAETMNNYLMCGRLLKTTYLPPSKQHSGFFSGKPWTPKIYPKAINRVKELRKLESPISEEKYKKNVKKSMKQLSVLEKKLKKAGVNLKIKAIDAPK